MALLELALSALDRLGGPHGPQARPGRVADPEGGPAALVLDLSRLFSRSSRLAPTGIDRVEFAYARHLLGLEDARTLFCAEVGGRLREVRAHEAARLLAILDRLWWRGWHEFADPENAARFCRRLRSRLAWRSERSLFARIAEFARHAGGEATYLLVSHHHLEHPAILQRLKAGAPCRIVCLLHDLIPLDFPEFARPGEADRHLARLATLSSLADAVILNSEATARSFRGYALSKGLNLPPTVVAPLGIEGKRKDAKDAPSDRPYFVVLGTIEPRKNHLLLLQLWRRLVERLGTQAPRLLMVGRRGWENENVLDFMERCAVLRGTVEELGPLPDRHIQGLLMGARALLFPSFAQGFGLPLFEAVALGVPAVCSDLPAFRELAGSMPDYLDPLDGIGWHEAVMDYSRQDSPRRQAQLNRLSKFTPPSWRDHFATVAGLLAPRPPRAAIAREASAGKPGKAISLPAPGFARPLPTPA